MRSTMFLTSILAVTSAILALAPAAPAITPLDREYFGINTQFLFLGAPQEQWPRHLDAIAATGMGSVRYDALWHISEPEPPSGGVHRYRWDHLDAVVGELARRGLRWFPIVSFSAPWTESFPGDHTSPPRDFGAYATYAGALTRRYGPGGEFWRAHPELVQLPVTEWEIWNEPNVHGFWPPVPSPERYADLYIRARQAVRTVDPSASVIIGGLGDAPQFVPRMYAHRPELRGNVDGVGIHPYARNPDDVLALLAEMRRSIDAAGAADVPIAITEMGWPTGGAHGENYPIPADRRAEYVKRTTELIARSDCGVKRITPYAWLTDVRDPRSQERWFGWVERDAVPTSTTRAFSLAISELRADWTSDGPRGGRLPLCDRTPILSVERHASRRPSGARPRSCYRATVTLGSVPLRDARVEFRFTGRDRRGKRRHGVVRTTDAGGAALTCFSAPRRRTQASALVTVSASHADLARSAVASAAPPGA